MSGTPHLGQSLVLGLFQLPQVLVGVQVVAPASAVGRVRMAFLLADQVLQVEVHRQVVQVFPEIRAENGPICGFRIVNTDWGKIPFEVKLISISTT